MKTAVAHLEPHMEKADAGGKGIVVIGTVKGDVHDIGKNLVDIILTNNGYEVHNIGIKAPLQTFLDKAQRGERRRHRHERPAREEHADHAREPRGAQRPRPVRRPGAARRRRAHAHVRGARPAPGLQGPPLLREGRVRGPQHHGRPHGRQALGRRSTPSSAARSAAATCPRARASAPTVAVEVPARSDVAVDVPVFTPPFLGARVAKGIALDEIAAYVNETALFRNQWQFRPEKPETDDEFKARIRPVLREQLGIAQAEGTLVPAVSLGLLPRERRRQRPRGVDRRRPAHRAAAVHVPASAEGPIPLHLRLLPPGRLRRGRLRRLPRRDDGRAGQRARTRAVRGRPLPGLPPVPRPVGGDDRGAGRVLAPPHP